MGLFHSNTWDFPEYLRSFLSWVYYVPHFKDNSACSILRPVHHIYHYTHFLKKLVLGQLNGQEMFIAQAMEVKKLEIISFIFLLQF